MFHDVANKSHSRLQIDPLDNYSGIGMRILRLPNFHNYVFG